MAEARFRPCAGRFRLVLERLSHLEDILANAGLGPVARALMDTGMSRDQLLDQSRGFSFDSGGLSMKLNPAEPGPDAAEIVNNYSEELLREIFSVVGKGREGRRAARAIARYRDGKEAIEFTAELAEVIAAAVGHAGGPGKETTPGYPLAHGHPNRSK